MEANIFELEDAFEEEEFDEDENIVESNIIQWYEKNIFSCYIFPEKDRLRVPASDENLKGDCGVCGKSSSGRIAANGNFTRHYVINFSVFKLLLLK